MPTYEYKCDACGHRFDQSQSIKADALKKCPSCGKLQLKRLISAGGGLIFKGSGFYITDYRDSAYKDKAKAESGGGSDSKESKPTSESSAPSTSAEPKSSGGNANESKPAAKAEPAPAPKAEKSESKTQSDKKKD